MNEEIAKDGWVLCHARTGKTVVEGEVVLDFRGEADTVMGGTPPHKPSSTGRVWVQGGEFYPTVFDLVWRRDKSA
jgi:hypothetical protein